MCEKLWTLPDGVVLWPLGRRPFNHLARREILRINADYRIPIRIGH
jgi:hypothetical protein